MAGQRALLDQIEALERVHGLPAGGPPIGIAGKRGWVTRQAFQNYFHSQICQCLKSVTAKMAETPEVGNSAPLRPGVSVQLDLVPRDWVSHPGGSLIQRGKLTVTTQQLTWPRGSRSQVATPGPPWAIPVIQPFQAGGFTPTQPPLDISGSGGGFGPDDGGVPGDDQGNSRAGGGGEPGDDLAPGGGDVPPQNAPPVPDGWEVLGFVPQFVPINRGSLEVGSGLLQADVLMQLISAVIARVAPIAKAAFAGQQAGGATRGDDDTTSTLGAKKTQRKWCILCLGGGGLLWHPGRGCPWSVQWRLTYLFRDIAMTLG